MTESKEQASDPIQIQYVGDLKGTLSSSSLEDETVLLWKECLHNEDANKRSETRFLKTVIDWETGGHCTLQDLAIVLGWHFQYPDDPSWKKAKNLLSLEQKEQLVLPTTKEGVYSAYEDKEYKPGRGAYAEWRDKRKW